MYLVIDLEATCWENNKHRGENEIIEIGACLVSKDLKIVSSLGTFVRPLIHRKLSDFCKNLTGISQEQVDSAPFFPLALENFERDVIYITDKGLNKHTFCSWGNYDKTQLELDCQRHSFAYPFGKHINLKNTIAQWRGEKRKGVKRMMEAIRLQFKGIPHRGRDDAYNIARVMIHQCREYGRRP